MDYITELPKSQGYDAVLVLVDRFTKMSHFIPCNKTITAKKTAELFIDNVVKLHGLPEEVISDRGPQFTSKFWKHLLQSLGVCVKLSSAFHPESDGQTERVNQVLEQYIRCMINYKQDNWSQLLPLAEFSYNNSVHSAAKKTPFFVNYGMHPRFDINAPKSNFNPEAGIFVKNIAEVWREMKSYLNEASSTYEKYANKKRISTPMFSVGDRVWLLRKHIKTTRPNDKLDYRKLGPFRIIEMINPVAFRLELPDNIKVHNVFHASLLERYYPNKFEGRNPPPAPPVEVKGNLEYEVEEVLDSKWLNRRLYYLVHWLGYEAIERTWEPVEHLSNASKAIKEFHRRNPGKPGGSENTNWGRRI